MMEQTIKVKSPITISDIFEGYTFVIITADDVAHFFKDDINGKLAYDGYREEYSKCVEGED